MSSTATAALAVLLFSGIYLGRSDSWSAIYKAAVLLHPALGILFALWLLLYYTRHAVDKTGVDPAGAEKGRGDWKLPALILGLTALSALWPRVFLPFAAAAAGASFLAFARAARAGRLQSELTAPALRWRSAYFLLTLSLITGVALLPVQGLAREKIFFSAHRAVSLGLTAAFAVFLAASLFFRIRETPEESRRRRRRVLASLSVLAVFGGAAALALLVEKSIPRPSLTFSMSTIPIEKRPAEDQFPTPFERKTAERLLATGGCAANEGCHRPIMEDYEISAHSLSVRPHHFLKNIDLLAEEIGKKNQLLCAGCHYPFMMFSGEMNLRHELNLRGFGCTYCHRIDRVRMHPTDRRISYITVESHDNHLSMFDAPGGEGTPIPEINALMVKMNPGGHGRVFKKPLYAEDAYCQACHGLQIVSAQSMGLARNTCIKCHMQPRHFLGREGSQKNHFFPGTNATVPYELGQMEAVRLIQEWAIGDYAMDVPSVQFWDLRQKAGDRSKRAVWLFMNIEPIARPVPGEGFSFNVITTNVGIDHQFPSAPLDMIEAWAQVTATDADGRVLYEIGKLNDRFLLPEGYPDRLRLGGYMLDSQDHVLIKNRVWDIKKKVINRNIKSGETQKDLYQMPLPENARGPIHITAQWNYRKHNQEYIEWGFAEEGWSAERPKTSPVTVVGRVEKTIDF